MFNAIVFLSMLVAAGDSSPAEFADFHSDAQPCIGQPGADFHCSATRMRDDVELQGSKDGPCKELARANLNNSRHRVLRFTGAHGTTYLTAICEYPSLVDQAVRLQI